MLEMKLLLTETEARAALGGISRTTLWKLRRDGLIHPVKIYRAVRFSRAEVERFAAEVERLAEAAR